MRLHASHMDEMKHSREMPYHFLLVTGAYLLLVAIPVGIITLAVLLYFLAREVR